MMKKNSARVLVLLLGMALAAGLLASADEDYKVIKNAVKGSAAAAVGAGSVRYFKILVAGKANGKENVKITLPVSLVEIMLSACPEKQVVCEGGHAIDIQRIWRDLKAAGPLALVELEDREETVKIWLE